MSIFHKESFLIGFHYYTRKSETTGEQNQKIVQLKPPCNIKELRSFFGLTGFYRIFFLNYAKLTSCFTRLLRKDTKWEWEEEQQSCFNLLKEEISKSVFLKCPYHDGRPYYIITDSSKDVSASALLQKDDDNRWRLISTHSKVHSLAMSRSCNFTRELFTIVDGLKKFSYEIFGRETYILTDYKAITYMQKSRDVDSKLYRISVMLSDKNIKWLYIKGKLNPVDVLSRPPEDTLLQT
ncbi:hypothetical protein QYM36_019483 [Artemia franciscana]|uniref:RNA-directed DNA polymerase n=1 Tax=Artemia franciscana TaxID=6661 RepID=A0AA88H579_ARTSF|nr:hypothetical protein QYM36_019483 [Artemia franciscana]